MYWPCRDHRPPSRPSDHRRGTRSLDAAGCGHDRSEPSTAATHRPRTRPRSSWPKTCSGARSPTSHGLELPMLESMRFVTTWQGVDRYRRNQSRSTSFPVPTAAHARRGRWTGRTGRRRPRPRRTGRGSILIMALHDLSVDELLTALGDKTPTPVAVPSPHSSPVWPPHWGEWCWPTRSTSHR